MVFLEPHHGEGVKAVAHGIVLAAVAVCGAYNAAAWWQRREPHLAFNALAYGVLAVWEAQHVAHHLRDVDPHEAR